MKSISSSLGLIIVLSIFFTLSRQTAFSSSLQETHARAQILDVAKSLESLKDEFSYIHLSMAEREEVDGQIYTLKKRIDTLRPKDEFEWVQSSEIIEANYIDLLRNLHTYKVLNDPIR